MGILKGQFWQFIKKIHKWAIKKYHLDSDRHQDIINCYNVVYRMSYFQHKILTYKENVTWKKSRI